MVSGKVSYIHTEDIHNTVAANIVVPMIIDTLHPKSVLDVGCGIGTWLSVFSKNGIDRIVGIDGEYVDKELLTKYIKADQFISTDLSKKFNLNQKFDLVISLEVAEHLPSSSADDFVSSLVLHSDNILFSAAIPFQIGQNHINEQWQSYWVTRFATHGYIAYDWLRPMISVNNEIDIWYRQNIIFFSKGIHDLPKLSLADFVLPELWLRANQRIISYENRINRIVQGEAGMGFYFKCLLKSIANIVRTIK